MPRQHTTEERGHMDRVAGLGCRICTSPAMVHHLTGGKSGSQRASDFDTIPLCPRHHLATHGNRGVALHAGVKTWEGIHRPQLFHLQATRIALVLLYPQFCVYTGVRIDPTTDQLTELLTTEEATRVTWLPGFPR